MFFKKKILPVTHLFDDTFVDIHSHLLPSVDDGAEDINDAMELISGMSSYGIKNFITTPHVLGDLYPNATKVIKSKLKEVQTELKNRGFYDISFRAAAEYMLDEQFSIRLQNNDILTLKDNYILVEMSFFSPPINLYEILFDIHIKGYKPVLAHPERYVFFHSDVNNYYKLKKAGCLFQLNFLSLTDHYGKDIRKACEKLLKLGLYDFVGTDIHHSKHLKLLKLIVTEKNKKKLKLLLTNNSKFFSN
ncbi:MAG: histidinol phosphatase [Flavobacteriaceae bacterium]|nr:MAG: histidinol phosphatase [Flavobacteriaceae bacterium]